MGNDSNNPYEEPVTPLGPEASKKSAWPSKVLSGLLLAGVVVVILGMLVPGSRRLPRHAMLRIHCAQNLKQIGLALHQYRSDYGSFPPIVTKDVEGRSLHSWRVLLLPYLEEKALYDRIDLSQPWDAPVHQALHAQCPKIYRCPSSLLLEGHTTYQAILDSKAWKQNHAPSSDGSIEENPKPEHVMVLETYQDQTIPWMNPSDPDWKSYQRAMSKSAKQQIHRGLAAYFLLVDGSVDGISEERWNEFAAKTGE